MKPQNITNRADPWGNDNRDNRDRPNNMFNQQQQPPDNQHPGGFQSQARQQGFGNEDQSSRSSGFHNNRQGNFGDRIDRSGFDTDRHPGGGFNSRDGGRFDRDQRTNRSDQ